MSRLDPNGSDFDPSKKTTVSLGPSAEDLTNKSAEEEVKMPEGPIKTAASYGERARARQAATQAIKKGGKPLGGAPFPKEKLHQLAESMTARPSFDEEGPPEETPRRAPQEPPKEMTGVGAAYHVNQEMARGNIDRPVSMKEAKAMSAEASKERSEARKPLSPESVEALEKATKQVAEEEVAEPPKPDIPDIEEDLSDAERAMIEDDTGIDMDFAGIQQARLSLISSKRRKAIEDDLSPLDITDMITKREIRQDIPVIPGKVTYTYRTFNQHEHLFCLQHVFEHRGSQTYAEELLNTCKLTCALVAINGAPLPEHRKDIGTSKERVDEEAFKKKMFHVGSFPTQMIADMSVNAIWFEERVNKLFSLDDLKNG